MAERGIGAVVVVDGETVLGMLTERDYARKIVLQDAPRAPPRSATS